MHIAILDEELPYPLTSGKRLRTWNLLVRLAQRHRLTYLCHRNADAQEAGAAAEQFRRHGISPIVVDRSAPPKRGPGFYARLAGNLLSPLPYSVATHTSSELTTAMRKLAADDPVDLWHCEWTPYAESMKSLPGAPWIVVAHNVESLIWQRYMENESNPVKRWYIRKQWQKFVRFERWAYSHARRTIAVSPDDARLIRDQFGGAQVDVVDNGVDPAYFHPGRIDRNPAEILFLGSLDWRPNLDGVQILIESIFPQVLRQIPEATLTIVGRNPPDWLRTLANQPRVELHGSVPDVRPFLHRCGMLAVPLRIGGGSRLKILEALAAGTPVVSTRIGAEGLELIPDSHLQVAESIDDLAEWLVDAIRDPHRSRQRAEAARRRVLDRYDWDALAEKLNDVWMRAARPCADRRRFVDDAA